MILYSELALKNQSKKLLLETSVELEKAINSSLISQQDLLKAYMILVDLKLGVNKIEDAERLKEKFMEVTRENAVELEEDCYFLADLRECTVFDTTGKELGRIYDVIQTKNNDVYWIRKPKELLIPVLKDIVLDINIDERKIIIRPVGEWMDED